MIFQLDRLLRALRFSKLKISLFEIERGSHKFTYRGVVCRKNPIDLALLQELIFKVSPDLIVEIGTNHGGSALYLADLLELSLNDAVVHTIDIEDHGVPEIVKTHKKIEFYMNGYQEYDSQILTQYPKKIIIDDGSHSYQDVLAVLKKFAPYFNEGDYFVIEDGALTHFGWGRHYGGGPLKAISKFLSLDNTFRVDFEILNKFGKNSSSNTYGYIYKCVK
jgi:cephalosporin hydroxylase